MESWFIHERVIREGIKHGMKPIMHTFEYEHDQRAMPVRLGRSLYGPH
jgi:hypothetical protein